MAVVTAILAGFVPLDYLWDMVSIGTLVAFIVVSIGVIILRVREPDLPRAFKVPGYPVTPVLSVLACASCSTACLRSPGCGSASGSSVVLIFYLVWSRHHSALNDGGRRLHPDRGAGDDEVMFDESPQIITSSPAQG